MGKPPKMDQGLLISFDGLDSSGKETQARLLADRLRYLGHIVHTFATPDYTTASGQELKRQLQNPVTWQTTPWPQKLEFFAANRAEHRDEVLAALTRGDIVIYDRYVPSSLTFIVVEALLQDATLAREDIRSAVKQREYREQGMPLEDASIFLDVPPHIATTLLEHRRRKLSDQAEYTDHINVQTRLYNEYDLLYADDPKHYLRITCVTGEKLLGINDIAELVWLSLKQKLPQLI